MTELNQDQTPHQPLTPFVARARFFAHKEEIETLLAQAHSMRHVWKDLRQRRKLILSYGAFRLNVRKYLPDACVKEPPPKSGKDAPQDAPQPPRQQQTKMPYDQKPPGQRFHYDPATARREDFI